MVGSWTGARKEGNSKRTPPKIANYEIDGVKIRIDTDPHNHDIVRISRIDEDAGKIVPEPDPKLLYNVYAKIVDQLAQTPSIKFNSDIIPEGGNYFLIPVAPDESVSQEPSRKTHEIPERRKSTETPRPLTFEDVKAAAYQLGEPIRAKSLPAKIIDDVTGREVRPTAPRSSPGQ